MQNCLAKDPDKRWQTAHDVGLQLEWIRDAGSQAGVPRVKGERRITRERYSVGECTVSAPGFRDNVCDALLSTLFVASAEDHVHCGASAGIQADSRWSNGTFAGRSPDRLRCHRCQRKKSLWVRALDLLSPRLLEGSESIEDYYSFTWTPDGRAVVAQVNGKLVRLSATGGANEVLCEKFDAVPSTINRDGMILAWTAPPTKIFSVSPDDCTLRDKSPSDAPGSDVGYGYPHFLPDGNHFLFAAIRKDKHHEIYWVH